MLKQVQHDILSDFAVCTTDLLKGAFYTKFPLLEEDWVITKE
jgi:hypothetical protein